MSQLFDKTQPSAPPIFPLDSRLLGLWERIKALNGVRVLDQYLGTEAAHALSELPIDFEDYSPLRKGAVVARMLAENMPISLDQAELFAAGSLLPAVKEELPAPPERAMNAYWGNNGNSSHIAVDYAKLLHKGIQGILEDVRTHGSRERAEFDACMTSTLESVLLFGARLRSLAEETLSIEPDERRKGELRRMADALSRVPFQPAGSFYEAIQSLIVYHVFLKITEHTNDSIGRIDYILDPWYRQDLANGTLTQQDATNQLAALFLVSSTMTDYADSVTIAGQTEDGELFYNDLTYFCLDIMESLRNQDPQVGLRILPGHPRSLLQRAFRPIFAGVANPSIFNDQKAVEALHRAGFTLADARNYVNCQCVELSAQGKCNIMSGLYYWDLSIPVKELLGISEGNTFINAPSYEQFLEQYFVLLEKHLVELVENILPMQERDRSTPSMSLVSSALIEDCIAVGRPALAGGARYNFTFPTFIGSATAVDSLEAIRRSVYEDKKFTLGELGQICRDNFAHNESFRNYLLNDCDKYGNNTPRTDALMKRLTEFISEVLSRYRNLYGQTIGPCFFGFITQGEEHNIRYATPDGRMVGEAVSCTFGSDMGRDKFGPTALLHSAVCFDHALANGGLAVNLTINKQLFSVAEEQEKLIDLIRGYLDMGGMQVQFNFVSHDDLLDAQVHPERHQQLLVRVAGFTGKFIELNTAIQNQIIDRVRG